jgi:hypothetical protein
MIDDRSVPFIVFLLVVIIAFLGRPIATRSRPVRRRPRNGAESIARLGEALGVGVIVQSIDEGPPFTIEASLLRDTQAHHVVAAGPSEDEAWDDLARKVTQWANQDPRTIRTVIGGGL